MRCRSLPSWIVAYRFDWATMSHGDGSVTVASALPPSFDLNSVMIRFADLSLIDRAKVGFAFHALLPTLEEVQTVASRFLCGEHELLPLNLRRFEPSDVDV